MNTSEARVDQPENFRKEDRAILVGMEGIGLSLADRMVEHFSSGIFEIIANTPERLRSIHGIGEKRSEMIRKAWSNLRIPCLPLWRVVAASVSGTKHEELGQTCQDVYHYYHIVRENVLVAAVADGAGSAMLGEVGADVAAQTAVETIVLQHSRPHLPQSDDDWKLLLLEALKASREAIKEEAKTRKVAERDLATTLILVVATPRLVLAMQVGDGASVVGDVDGNIVGITEPRIGEYINETTFLISPNASETAQLVVWHGAVSHLAIISDGLQMLALKMPEKTPHVPFFSPLFHSVMEVLDKTGESKAKDQLEAFLRSARIREKTDDDLTLLIATLDGG